ncbi:hypothetical protein NEIELOOT_00350 [Neisseria elongata subsp. glycolytica ATCC 29315]|uniref:Uncharacterized protein n=1 Tax=Neisseria elongata subsp. glycolytica ATCC 29315 TaxID=546263 RepID=D4DMS6_NEIEG|nr:hypothetical protein NEIELOOT_00350 [Neisseria elongata subsp. glycolytica ATCC 29315]
MILSNGFFNKWNRKTTGQPAAAAYKINQPALTDCSHPNPNIKPKHHEGRLKT